MRPGGGRLARNEALATALNNASDTVVHGAAGSLALTFQSGDNYLAFDTTGDHVIGAGDTVVKLVGWLPSTLVSGSNLLFIQGA